MHPPGPEDDKAVWRRWADTLPSTAALAPQVVAKLRVFLVEHPGRVGAYSAIGGEVPLGPLLEEIDDLVLPRLDAGGSVSWHRADRLERHHHGMLQPAPDTEPVTVASLDVVLVPGRVFDRRGIRLGRGGGHYDRLLPLLRPGTAAVGVTVEERLVAQLPAEAHDAPMTHLATETGVRSVGVTSV